MKGRDGLLALISAPSLPKKSRRLRAWPACYPANNLNHSIGSARDVLAPAPSMTVHIPTAYSRRALENDDG